VGGVTAEQNGLSLEATHCTTGSYPGKADTLKR
jgi:hypothetical protein